MFHVQETDKYDTYYGNRFSGEYEIPAHGLPPSATRYDLGAVATVGTVAPCFEEPLPSLPLPGADDDLFGPASPAYVHEDVSPTFEKPLVREIEKTIDDARFIAQHAKNKDKFESVSTRCLFFISLPLSFSKYRTTYLVLRFFHFRLFLAISMDHRWKICRNLLHVHFRNFCRGKC